MGQDEVTPSIVGMLFGIIVAELYGGTAYATMQAHPHGTVAGVKMIHFNTFYVIGGIHQAIRWVRGDGHSVAEIVYKRQRHASCWVTPSLESITCHLKDNLYVFDEIEDLVRGIQVGLNSADHELHVNISNFLVPAVCLEDQ